MSDSALPPDAMRDLAPGYALGALSPDEMRTFEAALSGSPELQRELAEFRELSALLALQNERAPAAELKQRLRERIAAAKVSELPSGTAVPASRRRPLVGIVLGAALAASLLLSIGLLFKARALQDALASRDQRLAEREALLNALLEPTVLLTTLTATGEAPPVVQVFWNRAAHSLILNTFRLKPAPPGRAYQLWLMPKRGNPIPSTVFNTEPGGHQLVQGISVPANEEIAGFALSVEPEGGSAQPTSTPILFGTAGGI